MSNLLKSNYVIKKEETRVIDSNELIASRLQSLSEMMDHEPETEYDYDEEGGFTEGLNAEQLEMLLDDNPEGRISDEDDAEEGGVIHADSAAMMEEVRREAEELLENARNEAQEIIDSANHEAESIKASFREQGYSEGYEQGHSEGLKVIEEKEQELADKQAEFMAEYDKKLEEMEPLLVDTITDIFEHIFHVSLSSNREIMLNLLHDTVRNVEGGKNFIVHVSKNDFEYINDRKDQLTEGLGSTDTIEVIEDLTLRQSECFVEAEGGIYDCGIGTELELLKKELMLLAYQKS